MMELLRNLLHKIFGADDRSDRVYESYDRLVGALEQRLQNSEEDLREAKRCLVNCERQQRECHEKFGILRKAAQDLRYTLELEKTKRTNAELLVAERDATIEELKAEIGRLRHQH